MITSLPSVQFSCKRARRIVHYAPTVSHADKRRANRGHRRALNRATRLMRLDPERFYGEVFNAPSLSGRDIA
jgi:hypothetical protein